MSKVKEEQLEGEKKESTLAGTLMLYEARGWIRATGTSEQQLQTITKRWKVRSRGKQKSKKGI